MFFFVVRLMLVATTKPGPQHYTSESHLRKPEGNERHLCRRFWGPAQTLFIWSVSRD